MSGLRINVRAGERVWINGAVLRADRKVGLELLNDVTFLLEQHVMTPEQTTTPMRQLYFMVQTLLVEPAAAKEARALADASLTMTLRTYANRDILDGLLGVRELIAAGRPFEALRAMRALFPIEEALLGHAGLTHQAKEANEIR
jgi:flagellar biosynthesis repressor protein FlbT